MNDINDFATELFRIVSGALRLDALKVRNYTAFLAEKLDKAGETETAARLRKILDESDRELRPADFRASAPIPVDSDTRFPLVEKVNSDPEGELLVLTNEQRDLVSEFLAIAKSQGQLEKQGMKLHASLLIYGPPGCGKSSLARHIASQLQLPLYMARIDGLISSFLGNTAKNIRSVFEFASKGPCVLFLDEFDAIAKLRDDKQELGELKRVVNSFLQNLDSLGNETIIIAATNHQQLLDAAVWRRFSYTMALSLPNKTQRKEIWRNYLKLKDWSEHDLDVFTDLSEHFTGAEIREVCLRLRRQSIVHGTIPSAKEVFTGLRRIAAADSVPARFMSVPATDSNRLAVLLRERNAKLYSHAVVAGLLGVSKATAFRFSNTKFVPEKVTKLGRKEKG